MPIFEGYMTRLVVKNGDEKDTYAYEIRLWAQNKDTIIGLIVNTLGYLNDHLKRKKSFHYNLL